MTPLVYALPGYEVLGASLLRELDGDRGELVVRQFPDGETYVRLLTLPAGRPVVFACGLDRPNDRIIELYFAASTARELGATSVGLVAPYLAYMRQDARFNNGEAITSTQFARWLSQYVDWLITVDPHLHRHPRLSAIYSIPTTAVSSAAAIAHWIRLHVHDSLIIGPDEESVQWTQDVAHRVDCPAIVLHKQRHGDRDVEVSVPDVGDWQSRTPVLIDDIISTAHTMMAAAAKLSLAGMSAPVCVGVHALFCGESYAELKSSGVKNVVTCNTVAHPTNAIDVFLDITNAIRTMFPAGLT